MQMKVPNCSGNSYVGGGDNYEGDTSSDYDEVLEFSSEGEANDFSDFLWMEDEDAFESQVFAILEEQELENECMEAMNVDVLLDEIRQVEAEQFDDVNSELSDVAEKSSLNPFAREFIPCTLVAVSSN